MKRTEWFPGTVVPTRKGVYETQMPGKNGYSYWDGRQWGNQFNLVERANQLRHRGAQNKPWRGLAENPKVGRT